MAIWADVTGTVSNWAGVFVAQNSGGGYPSIHRNGAGSQVQFRIYSDGDDVSINGPSGSFVVGWQHYALTWDGATLRGYWNGVEVVSGACVGTTCGNGQLGIGSGYFNGNYSVGLRSDALLYDKVLTPSEIAALAGVGSPDDLPTGELGHWLGDADTLENLADPGVADATANTGTSIYVPGGAFGTVPEGPRFGKASRYFNSDVHLNVGKPLTTYSYLTLAVWFRTDNTSQGDVGLFYSGYGGGGVAYLGLLLRSDGGVRLDFDDGGSRIHNSYTASDLRDGKWHHAACVMRDNGANKEGALYIDGEFIAVTGVHSDPSFTCTVDWTIGSLATGYVVNDTYFANAVAYDRDLSDDEIAELADYRTTTIPAHPIGAWVGDENSLIDLTGNGHDATGTGAGVSSFVAEGPLGNVDVDYPDSYSGYGSQRFSNGYVSIPNPIQEAGAFSVAVWVNIWDSTSLNGIYGNWVGTGSNVLVRVDSNATINFYTFTGGQVGGDFTDLALSENTWHHLVVTYDGATMRAYLDGTQSSTTFAQTGTLRYTPGQSYAEEHHWGYMQGSGGNPRAYMSEGMVYDRALSASEVTDLSNMLPVATPLGRWFNAQNSLENLENPGTYDGTNVGTTHSFLGPSGALEPVDNSPTFGAASRAFDGVDDVVTVASDPFELQSFTASAWVKLSASKGYARVIAMGTSYGWSIEVNGLNPRIESAASTEGFSVTPLVIGQWAHLCLTWESGGNVTFYQDGVQQDFTTTVPLGYNNQTLMGIGAIDNATWLLEGNIADVRIYNRALSASEVADVMNLDPLPEGLVYRGFSNTEETAPLLVDWSGNGHWAENTGSVWSSDGPGLLLDVHTDALAGYSTRLIRLGYSGALFGVRRISDDVRADLYPNGDGEITLDSPVTITSGSSSATTLGELSAAPGHTDVDGLGAADSIEALTWYDQSGRGNDASHTTINWFIYVVQAGVLSTEGGKFALDFDSREVHSYTFSTPDFNVSEFTLVDVSKSATYNGVFANKTNTEFGKLQNWDGKALLTGPTSWAADGTLAVGYLARRLRSYVHTSTPTARLNGATDTIVKRAGWTQTPLRSVYIGGRAYQHPAYRTETNLQEALIFAGDKSADLDAIEADINAFYSIY